MSTALEVAIYAAAGLIAAKVALIITGGLAL
jgi:hypothetical protein